MPDVDVNTSFRIVNGTQQYAPIAKTFVNAAAAEKKIGNYCYLCNEIVKMMFAIGFSHFMCKRRYSSVCVSVCFCIVKLPKK